MEDGLLRLSKKPRSKVLIVSHKVHDANDVVMRLCVDGICGERIRTGKGLVNGIIDVGILGNRNRLVGREEVLEEGQNGRHVGVLINILCIDGLQFFYEARMGLFFNAHWRLNSMHSLCFSSESVGIFEG